MRIKPNHRHLPWNTKVPDCITLSATLGTAGARVPNAGGQASGLCKGVLAHGIIVQKHNPLNVLMTMLLEVVLAI